jgi:antagonist of KipI
MSIQVLKGGLLTTIQDTGRFGHQKNGILVSGAMDPQALRIANALVANPLNAATLEINQAGPSLLFTTDLLIALTGACLSPCINNIPVKEWRPILVKQGSILTFGAPRLGCRAYMAVGGGVDVPLMLGSRSTYLRAQLGGIEGRALQQGDTLNVLPLPAHTQQLFNKLLQKDSNLPFVQATWMPSAELLPAYETNPVLRVIKGPEHSLFSEESKEAFWQSSYQVSTQSDRMGYRLSGKALLLAEEAEQLSSAVTFGTIQVPPDGQPIILMADHQTTGGYPRIGHVATTDLPLLAQVTPGQHIRFTQVSLQAAQQLYIEQEQKMQELEGILQIKFKNY